MRNKSFSIQIEKPCTVNLSGMTRHEVRLFCTHCEKHVIDFSKLSDEEVIRIVEKMDEKFCGRFTKSQLDRVFTISKKKQASPRLNKILAGLFALGMLETTQINAQEKKNVEMVQVEKNKQSEIPLTDSEKNNISGDTTKNVVRGIVLNADTKSPVTYGNVIIGETVFYSKIDSAGKFSFSIPDSLVTDSISIRIFSNGYESDSVKISKAQLSTEQTFLLREEMLIEGGVGRIETIPCNKTPKKKIKH
jgi:hypothetical protein